MTPGRGQLGRTCSQRSRRRTGSRPTVGSSSTKQLGLAQEGDSQRDPGPLASGEASDAIACRVVQADLVDHSIDVVGGRAEDSGEVADVLRDREVCVDGGILRHIGDPAAQFRGTRGQAQDRHRATGDLLDADDRRASAWSCPNRSGPSSPVMRPRCHASR